MGIHLEEKLNGRPETAKTQNKRPLPGNDQEESSKKTTKTEPDRKEEDVDSNRDNTDNDSVTSENTLIVDEWPKDEVDPYWTQCEKCEDRHYDGGCPKKNPVCQLDIGNNIYVVVNTFGGQRKVHIRVYETPVDRPMYPTKRGIALDIEKWSKLCRKYKSAVDDAIASYEADEDVDFDVHLGNNYRVTLKTGYPLVHIRRWFAPEDVKELRPTKKGIALRFKQWEKLKDAMQCVDNLIGDEVNSVQYCEDRPDHQSQLVAMQCPNCCPGMDLFEYV